ncbi:hypothetical protein TNCV_3101171 [Trichonephila clavipes]|nr:hypothetical protein TNCV_3101171 [Trichonephila clavipes]
MLDRRIAARQPLPTCLTELRRTLLDEWCIIPQDQIDNLLLSMPRRSRSDVNVWFYGLLDHQMLMGHPHRNDVCRRRDNTNGLVCSFACYLHFGGHRAAAMTVTAGSDVVQSGRPIFDDFFQHLWPYISNNTCLVTSSIPVPLKTRRVGQRCTLNLSRAETSSRWCGVVVREGASSGVVHVT